MCSYWRDLEISFLYPNWLYGTKDAQPMCTDLTQYEGPRNVLFVSIVWNLWKERNLFVFEKKNTPTNVLIDLILKQAKECAEILELDLPPEAKSKQIQRPWLTWLPPFAEDTIKINTDASKRNSDGMTAISGVLRNHRGEWIKGFIGCTGIMSVYMAEMTAIREALLLAKDLNISKLEIESDSETVVHCIYGNDEVLSEEYPLVRDCRELFSLDTWVAQATFQPRERNKLADAMAALGFMVDGPMKLLDEPPAEVKKLYIDDRICAATYVV